MRSTPRYGWSSEYDLMIFLKFCPISPAYQLTSFVPPQLEEEQSIKNASIWAMKEYYANFSRMVNDSEATPPPMNPADVIRGPCWETAVGIVMMLDLE